MPEVQAELNKTGEGCPVISPQGVIFEVHDHTMPGGGFVEKGEAVMTDTMILILVMQPDIPFIVRQAQLETEIGKKKLKTVCNWQEIFTLGR